MEYKVVEKFVSLNGEGNSAGLPAVFIRFAGCNLTCPYCDTKWANEASCAYEVMTADEIYRFIKTSGITNVTLTGGEPLLQKGIGELIRLLAKDLTLQVEIETNGSMAILPYTCIENAPAFTLDYKLLDQVEERMLTENYQYLNSKDAVKFVVASAAQLHRAREVIEQYGLTQKCSVHFSTVHGSIPMSEVAEFLIENKMNHIKFQPQLHKFIWDPLMRGV